MNIHSGDNGKTPVANTVPALETKGSPSSSTAPVHGPPEIVYNENTQGANRVEGFTAEEIDESKKGWFAYFGTKDFYVVLLLGYAYLKESRLTWNLC